MIREERESYDRCPGCDVPIYIGPIRVWSEDHEDEVDLGDIIYGNETCPRCGTELFRTVEKQWDDQCYVCRRPYAECESYSAEWVTKRQCYRWWCAECDDNLFLCIAAEVSRPIARLLRKPLTLFWMIFVRMVLKDNA